MILRHALRHALIPVMTILGVELGRLIAGSVIIEVVFSWPGIGRLMIESILKSDYPTVQAGIAVIAAAIAMGNLVVDLSYRVIDPPHPDGWTLMATRAGEVTVEIRTRRRLRVPHNWRRYLLVIPPLTVMIVFVFVGILADVIAPGDPGDVDVLARLERPVFDGGSSEHLLGTDHIGRDIWTRIIHGARVSLIVVAIVVPGAALFGTSIGLIAGWRSGKLGQLLMRFVDVQLAMPAILFAVLLGASLGASLTNVILILLIWTWTAYARLIRAEVLSLKEREFVLASIAAGGGNWWIMRKQLLPNVFNTIIVIMTLEIPIVIVAEASLSFLGVGAPVEQATWGRMITEARNYLTQAWWVMWMPGIALMLVALCGNLVGDWLRDLLDPRLRNLG